MHGNMNSMITQYCLKDTPSIKSLLDIYLSIPEISKDFTGILSSRTTAAFSKVNVNKLLTLQLGSKEVRRGNKHGRIKGHCIAK